MFRSLNRDFKGIFRSMVTGKTGTYLKAYMRYNVLDFETKRKSFYAYIQFGVQLSMNSS